MLNIHLIVMSYSLNEGASGHPDDDKEKRIRTSFDNGVIIAHYFITKLHVLHIFIILMTYGVE